MPHIRLSHPALDLKTSTPLCSELEKEVTMERQELIARLQGLREMIEQEGSVGIADLETTFALALSDVCQALGLTEEEEDLVLGPEAAAYVAATLDTWVWAVVLVPENAIATTTTAIPASGEGP